MMTFDEALDKVVKETTHIRYRFLCSDENPDIPSRDAYRRLVMRKATGGPAQETDAERAARLISENPPAPFPVPVSRGGCGPCPDPPKLKGENDV